jgi:hypothetical protein
MGFGHERREARTAPPVGYTSDSDQFAPFCFVLATIVKFDHRRRRVAVWVGYEGRANQRLRCCYYKAATPTTGGALTPPRVS